MDCVKTVEERFRYSLLFWPVESAGNLPRMNLWLSLLLGRGNPMWLPK